MNLYSAKKYCGHSVIKTIVAKVSTERELGTLACDRFVKLVSTI